MTNYHAVMIDETGGEFGVSVTAATKAGAYAILKEDYPESRVDQLESPADTAAREKAMYARISAELDGDGGYDDYDDDY